MTTPAITHYCAEFEAAAHALPGAGVPWLQQLRTDAIARFVAEGFPTPSNEAWKYTRVEAFEKHPFRFMPQADATQIDASPWHVSGTSHRLVFVDGRYAPALSQPSSGPEGVTVTNLADLLAHEPQRLEPWLAAAPATPFATLNTAFFNDGALIEINENVALEGPIHLLYLSTVAGLATHPRNIIVAKANARAVIVEHYVGLAEAASFTNAVTHLFVGRTAHIDHCKLQQESLHAFHIATIEAFQSEGSTFTSHSLSLGAALARHDIATRFDGAHSTATLNGLYVVGGQQHVDHNTSIDHAATHGTSREFYRGILDDHSRGVFTGRVIVRKTGQQADAAQANHNLLLSHGAEVDTRPQLEIYADDVKCTHGATIGQLDDDMLFYLRTRGIDNDLAHTMLTHAFAREVLERLPLDTLRARGEALLRARMPHQAHIEEVI